MKKDNKQVVIMNLNPVTMELQIIIPPFRPVTLDEIEEDYEELCDEISASIEDDLIAEAIVILLGAFKETLEDGNILPLMDYFGKAQFANIQPEEIQAIFDSLHEFMDDNHRDPKLMH